MVAWNRSPRSWTGATAAGRRCHLVGVEVRIEPMIYTKTMTYEAPTLETYGGVDHLTSVVDGDYGNQGGGGR